MAKILILIGGHLCTAPRPQKEAEVLSSAGHEVVVRGAWFDPELVKRDHLILNNAKWRFEPYVDFRSSPNRLTNLGVRFQGRVAKTLFTRFRHFSPYLLGYGVRQMLAVALQSKADMTIVHSESGLWVGNQLLDRKYKVGVDFEDWFSEDLLYDARKTRPIDKLKTLEARLIRECQYCVTTSYTLANNLAKAYKAPKPKVVYNTFPATDRTDIDGIYKDRRRIALPSLHWFSQTIGSGRGLEVLLKSLPKIRTQCEVHLRGNYPSTVRNWFEPQIPADWRDRVFMHPTVPNSELLSRIAEHDIGLALESPSVPSRDMTITNKLFQYLQGGLAIVATDTKGQREVLSKCPEVGCLIPPEDPAALAGAVEELLKNPGELAKAKANALFAYEKEFCWEKQSAAMVALIDQALNSSRLK